MKDELVDLFTPHESFVGGELWDLAIAPASWTNFQSDIWTMWLPKEGIASHGWKVHVSAIKDEAREVLRKAAKVAFSQGVPFKHLSGLNEFYKLHSKNSSRLQTGKMIALYPKSEMNADRLMAALTETLKDFVGIDVLTDRSYRGSKSVFYRWGTFSFAGNIDEAGNPIGFVPDGFGELVEDRRAPQFVLPDGIIDPFSETVGRLGAKKAPTELKFDQYTVRSALRYTNAGGRYRAKCDQTSVDVVLKEARPHTGFVASEDAKTRLRRERDVLIEMNRHSLTLAPQLKKYFAVGDFEYLAMESIPGVPLHDWVANESPFFSSGITSRSEISKYLKRAEQIFSKIQADMRELHRLGFAFGDLSSGNIIVSNDDNARLIDFETCGLADSEDLVAGTPDFCMLSNNATLSFKDRDEYALSCIAITLILRLTSMMEITRAVSDSLGKDIISYAGTLPEWFLTACNHVLRVTAANSHYNVSSFDQPDIGELDGRNVARKQLAIGIINQSQLSSPSIFPLSSDTDKHNTLSFSMGDAGILWALKGSGLELSQLLIERFRAQVSAALDNGRLSAGYAFGYSGLADVCSTLGLEEEANAALDLIQLKWRDLADPSLAFGLAGVAQTLARHNRTEDAIEAMALSIKLSQTFDWKKNGLFFGRSGVVASAATLDHFGLWGAQSVDSVTKLISKELDQAVAHSFGRGLTLLGEVDGKRLLPYLSDGNAGLLVALDLACQNSSLEFQLSNKLLGDLSVDLETPFTIDSSLANGSVGLALALEYVKARRPDSQVMPEANWGRLTKYMLPLPAGIGVLNPRTLNFDLSFSKGSAGILAALSWRDRSQPLNLMGLMLPSLD